MNLTISNIKSYGGPLLISLVYVVSLFYSKAILSISMLALLVFGVWKHRNSIGSALKGFYSDKAYFGLLLVFLVYVFSGFNTEDTDQWLKQIRIKLPFILLPLAFYLIGPLETARFKVLHIFLAVVAAISSIPVMIHYFSNQAELISAIGRGKYIPTPIDHIHYSIIMAYAALSMILLLVDSCIDKTKTERFLMGGLAAFLGIVLHFLAVRSGLAIFYLGLAFISVWYVYSSRNYLLGILGLLFVVVAPYVMYKTVPSLNEKIGYMRYDYMQYKEGKGNNYSDSERLMSYSIAVDLIKEEPILGHGIGDLKPLMIDRHISKYGEKEKYIFPHNQYLYVMAGIGIVGFLIFFVGILSPVLFTKPDPYLWLVYLAMLASFMVENTVQRAVSIGFFLLFILWSLGRQRACQLR